MTNVLELRPNPTTKSNGIDKYCQSLRQMFEGNSDITILPIENIPMRRTKLLKEIFDWKSLRELIKDKKVDVVHVNGYASFTVFQSLFYAARYKKKIIYTAHWHPFEFLTHPQRAKLFFNILIKPLVKRYVNVVVCLNKQDEAFFSAFHKRVVRIPHWCDMKIEESAKLTTKDPNMIMFVGRVNEENKGIEHLYELPEGKYNIHIVGAGERAWRSDMTHHFNISSEELGELYSKASLVVVPSKYEAFSYAALEALMHGTPVLLSDRVRIVDYVEGIKGIYIFEYHNYEEFNKKVELSIGSEVDKQTIISVFSIDRIRDQYKEMVVSIKAYNKKDI